MFRLITRGCSKEGSGVLVVLCVRPDVSGRKGSLPGAADQKEEAAGEANRKKKGDYNLQYIAHVRGQGPEFFAAACELRLEGIVSKQVNSTYRPGVVSKAWVKVKCSEYREFRNVKWRWWEH